MVLVLALLGAHAIWHAPQVLRALNPAYAVHFVLLYGQHTLFILGLVVLSVTGVEALYADMGHFGIADPHCVVCTGDAQFAAQLFWARGVSAYPVCAHRFYFL